MFTHLHFDSIANPFQASSGMYTSRLCTACYICASSLTRLFSVSFVAGVPGSLVSVTLA